MNLRFPLSALCALLAAGPLAAQKSADQARLVLTVGLGFVGGGDLWSVPNQPYRRGPLTDSLNLSRSTGSGIGFMFSGTYFPNNNLGLNAEAMLLGLGTTDGCEVSFTTGDPQTAEVCRSIEQRDKGGAGVALSLGAMYRFFSHSATQPYVRANFGFVVGQQSYLEMTGELVVPPQGEVADVPIYTDDHPDHWHPYIGLGAGFTAAIAKGYQVRLEARDNYVRLPVVTAATRFEGLTPPSGARGKHIFSLMIGFDVVLERKRGKRY